MTTAEIIELAARWLAADRSGDDDAKRSLGIPLDVAACVGFAVSILEGESGIFVIEKSDPDNTLAVAHSIAAELGAKVTGVSEDGEGNTVMTFSLNLLIMAIALSTGALVFGLGADRLRRRGIRPESILCAAALVFVGAELLLLLGMRSVLYAPWAVIASIGAATVLSYSALACTPNIHSRGSAGPIPRDDGHGTGFTRSGSNPCRARPLRTPSVRPGALIASWMRYMRSGSSGGRPRMPKHASSDIRSRGH